MATTAELTRTFDDNRLRTTLPHLRAAFELEPGHEMNIEVYLRLTATVVIQRCGDEEALSNDYHFLEGARNVALATLTSMKKPSSILTSSCEHDAHRILALVENFSGHAYQGLVSKRQLLRLEPDLRKNPEIVRDLKRQEARVRALTSCSPGDVPAELKDPAAAEAWRRLAGAKPWPGDKALAEADAKINVDTMGTKELKALVKQRRGARALAKCVTKNDLKKEARSALAPTESVLPRFVLESVKAMAKSRGMDQASVVAKCEYMAGFARVQHRASLSGKASLSELSADQITSMGEAELRQIGGTFLLRHDNQSGVATMPMDDLRSSVLAAKADMEEMVESGKLLSKMTTKTACQH